MTTINVQEKHMYKISSNIANYVHFVEVYQLILLLIRHMFYLRNMLK